MWFRDFAYYALRWTIIVGVLSALNPVYDIPTDASGLFWQIKLQQLLMGLGWGFLAALVFTLAQNGLNTQRRKPVSWMLAIGIWFGMGFLGALAMGRFADRSATPTVSKIETPEAREKSLQKASAQLGKELEEMKARAAKEQPDRPAAYVVQEEVQKKGAADLAKAVSNPAKQADIAADQFVGFYFVNTKARAAYCKELGVDISPFVQAFAKEHQALYQKSRMIHNRDPHGADMIETETYKTIAPHMRQVIADETKAAAQQNNITEKQLCQALAEHAQELVPEMMLEKINPPLYQAMMSAK